jgi:ABC-type transporter Mla subunit MlaD
MPDPATTVITDVTQVEKDLESVVKPDGNNLTDVTKGQPQPVLGTATQLLTLLYKASGEVKTVGTDIYNALHEAALLLNSVAGTLEHINNVGGTVTQTVTTLQNALATAQAIMPNAPPVLASGSQFFGQITTILTATKNDVSAAASVLYKFAQQLEQIARALKP